MEKADFIKLLEDPKQLEQWTYEQLEQLILEYPYCLSLRLLLLHKYQTDNNLSTQKYLELTAIYAPNLQKLEAFVNR
jgi:hypothetical protein